MIKIIRKKSKTWVWKDCLPDIGNDMKAEAKQKLGWYGVLLGNMMTLPNWI